MKQAGETMGHHDRMNSDRSGAAARRYELGENEVRQIKELGAAVIATEAAAVQALTARIGDAFVLACRYLLACDGRIVVLGMGKSGHIGGKIAATLASTGSPAFFVHPGEASHGDLGMITARDVVLAISNSGETEELLTILPLIKRLGVPLITLTGRAESTLARAADVNLDVSVAQEACPLGLAPTSSTTATLVMGDALAVSLLEVRGFTAEDFARSHPGGRLGRRLLLLIRDIMHTGDTIPAVAEDVPLSQALVEMTRKGLGMTAVVDAAGRLAGIFTDGDLRRVLDRRLDVHATPIAQVMTRNCKTAAPGMLAAEALEMMEKFRINALLVIDGEGRLVGALNMHDLLRAGVV
jgi:arabinose-5-phosphate isomerase